MELNIIKKKLTIGLCIFSKNEEKTIGKIIDNASKLLDKKDIFLIDGHSDDNTVKISLEKKINLLLDQGKGKGDGIQQAIKKIERDILIFMDSDGSHQCSEIPLLISPFLSDDNIAMVIGSRFKGGSEELSNSLTEIIRLAGNKLSVFLINKIWKVKLSDVQNGFRAIKRTVFKNMALKENGFAIEQEMVMKCLKAKKKIVEIPSWELKRKYNQSHIRIFRTLPQYLSSFIKIFLYD